MRTSNPVFGNRFQRYAQQPYATGQEVMTVEGTAAKTGVLLFLVLIGASINWYYFCVRNFGLVNLLPLAGLLGGLVVGLVSAFVPRYAAFTAPVYATLEGLLLGGISAVFELVYPGILFQ